MKVLVMNCGSSSLKYQLIEMETETSLAQGLVERIGIEGANLTQKSENGKHVVTTEMKDHNKAVELVLKALVDPTYGVIKTMNEIGAIGHRVVHGGEKYADSVLIDGKVMLALNEFIKLAPLHNPANIIGIRACELALPGVKQVAVFDTAFHQTMPEAAFMYAIPYEYYKKHGIRKYGFHGTSHKFVSTEAAAMLGKDIKELKLVTCHLGNGASCCAVKHGISVDTSMGFTPLAGLVMGTRSGDIDPAIVNFLAKEEHLTVDAIDNILNKKSGVLGLSGVSSDFRDIIKAAEEGNNQAEVALEVFCGRVRQTIGAYAATMGGIDAIVFTAGVGENSVPVRQRICSGLEFLGTKLDLVKNNVHGKERIISTDDSKVKILTIPTNEELVIARDTKKIIEGK